MDAPLPHPPLATAPAERGSDAAARKDPGSREAWGLRRSEPERARALAAELCSGDAPTRAGGLLVLAFCDTDRSAYETALAHLSEAEVLFTRFTDGTGLAGVALLRGVVNFQQGDYEAALAYLTRALELSRAVGADQLTAQALMRTGETYAYKGDYGRSKESLTRAEALIAAHGDLQDRSDVRFLQSRTARLAGDYGGALRDGLEALNLKRRAGDSLGEAYALNNLGLIYHDPHDSAQALSYYLEGLKLSEQLRSPRIQLALLGNLGELYGDMGDPENALSYTLQSLKLSASIGSRHTLGISLEGAGTLSRVLGDVTKAFAFYERALTLREEIGDRQGRASTLRHLGNLYAAVARRERTLRCFEQSLVLARETGHRYTEAEVLKDLGAYYQEQPQTAKGYLQQALTLAQAMKLTQLSRNCADALYRLSKAEFDTARALFYLELFYAADKILSDETAARETQRLLGQFELERVQQEAEIQRLRNVELVRVNEALKRTNEQNTELVAALKDQAKKLRRQAVEDSLTGLYNRRYAEQRLTATFERAARRAQPFSVALADIDDFKGINDRFSHAVGDRVLQIIAEILRLSLRRTDIAARYGGEEFVLIFPETPLEEGYKACEKLRKAVMEFSWGGVHPELKVTLSLGLCSDLSLPTYEKMVAVADAKLYKAKRSGKNRVSC